MSIVPLKSCMYTMCMFCHVRLRNELAYLDQACLKQAVLALSIYASVKICVMLLYYVCITPICPLPRTIFDRVEPGETRGQILL